MARAYIGVGSNIDPEDNVRQALCLLRRVTRVVAISTFFRVPAEGRPGQPSFYNGVVAVETDLPPGALRQALHGIEDALGRVRSADRNAPREIDLDLLIYADQLYDDSIPRRAFLAVPLAELMPDTPLPGTGMTARQVAALTDASALQPLTGYTAALRKGGQDELREGPASDTRVAR